MKPADKRTTYQFGTKDSEASAALTTTTLKTKFGYALTSGHTDIISGISATNNVYSTSTNNSDNLKFGSSKATGSMTLSINTAKFKVKSIIISAKRYGSEASGISVNSSSSTSLTASFAEYTYDVNGAATIKIDITSKRGYIDSITLVYEEL